MPVRIPRRIAETAKCRAVQPTETVSGLAETFTKRRSQRNSGRTPASSDSTGGRLQPAERAGRRSRMIVLHEGRGNAVLPVSIGMVGLDEEAAAVAMNVRLDDDDARQSGRKDAHSALVLEDANEVLAVRA